MKKKRKRISESNSLHTPTTNEDIIRVLAVEKKRNKILIKKESNENHI